MTTGIKHLRIEPHSAIGDVIQRNVAVVIERWAVRAKEEQPNAARAHHDTLLDHLPIFLAKLGISLSSAGDNADQLQREAEEHGDQRWDSGWSVTEVVRDYQILRIVTSQFLEESLGRRVNSRESLVLNVAIDDAIAASVSAFVASQTNPATGANPTRSEALDLLLNVLGTVGHEIRNPLAPLTNSLEILRLAGSDASRVEQIRQMMDRQLRVLSRLVDDLMDLPRLARGKMSLRRERVDVVGLVRACAEDRLANLTAAGLSLTLDIPSGPVWVIGDDTRLTQAFGNLIGNAQKFTDSGGSVTVRLSALENRRIFIGVADTGIGIDPVVRSKVFEAYIQADQSLDRSRGGLGLGLALVKAVIELHGGSVAVASDGLGSGATFTIELPIAEPQASQPSVAPAAIPARGQPRRVLIIEDNADSAESLQMYLEMWGHAVTVARNGADGISAASTTNPEVVICDVGLPGLDGYAVAAEIRRGNAAAPISIIAVTGHGPRLCPAGEPDKAFDHYLLKPVDPKEILRLFAELQLPTQS
jgi:signal transduction histidine kinase/ActR/RegA family two-component response regulator